MRNLEQTPYSEVRDHFIGSVRDIFYFAGQTVYSSHLGNGQIDGQEDTAWSNHLVEVQVKATA